MAKPFDEEEMFGNAPDQLAPMGVQAPAPVPQGPVMPQMMTPEQIKAEQDSNDSRKFWSHLVGGIGDTLSSSNSAGNYFLGRMNAPSTAGRDMAKAVTANIEDPVARQAKLYQNYKAAKDAENLQREDVKRAALESQDSNQTKALRMLAQKFGLKGAEGMSGQEIQDTLFDPKKMNEAYAKSQVDQQNDISKLILANKLEQGNIRLRNELEQKLKEGGRPLDAGQAADIGSIDAGIEGLKTFKSSANQTSDFSKAGRLNPGRYIPGMESNVRTEAYENQRRALAQNIGKALEGGKLTDADFESKYLPMFPKIDDPPAVKEAKLANVERMMLQAKSTKQQALADAGYNVRNFQKVTDVPANPLESLGYGAKGVASDKAAAGPHGASVKQNGHTYYWNAKTGKYE